MLWVVINGIRDKAGNQVDKWSTQLSNFLQTDYTYKIQNHILTTKHIGYKSAGQQCNLHIL